MQRFWLGLALLLAACAPAGGAPSGTPGVGPACPATPLNVVAAENQYGSLALQLGGACVRVVSVIAGADVDPHDYQIDARTARAYQDADVIFQNGLGYDPFSERLVSSLSTRPVVVTFGDVVGLRDGDNPHLWYSPDYLTRIIHAMTTAFQQARPEAISYFAERAGDLDRALGPYRDTIAEVRRRHTGTPIGTTETLFVPMAEATGLSVLTPPRLLDALAEAGQPSVADVTTMQNQIQQRQIRVLVYNAQTERAISRQWAAMAQEAGVPVVTVTETLPSADETFQELQVRQLRALVAALGD
ncbi:MAG: zinc ABC transporter substrate-binding protein [Dehalococcoidia bacterium]